MSASKIILSLIIIFCFQSCTKNVDFNQIDDANIQASYIATLVHLDLNVPNFLNKFNQEITFSQDLIQAPIPTDTRQYLEKIEFTVVTENTFDRNFSLNVIFYNGFNEPIYIFQPEIFIPENSSELITIIEIPEEDVDVIYDTEYFGFTLVLSESTDGSMLAIDGTANLKIKSSVELFFNYKKI